MECLYSPNGSPSMRNMILNLLLLFLNDIHEMIQQCNCFIKFSIYFYSKYFNNAERCRSFNYRKIKKWKKLCVSIFFLPQKSLPVKLSFSGNDNNKRYMRKEKPFTILEPSIVVRVKGGRVSWNWVDIMFSDWCQRDFISTNESTLMKLKIQQPRLW